MSHQLMQLVGMFVCTALLTVNHIGSVAAEPPSGASFTASNGMAAAQGSGSGSSVSLRTVKDDELTSRGNETEDNLRKYLLALYSDEKHLTELRRAINEPWSAQSLQNVFDIVLGPAPDSNTVDDVSMEKVGGAARLLAYVCKNYTNDSAVEQTALRLFDQLYSRLGENKFSGTSAGRVVFPVNDVLIDHGNSELVLIPSLWRALEASNLFALKAVELHGDAEALLRLEALSEKRGPKEGDVYTISISIAVLVLYERLKHPEDPSLRTSDDMNMTRFKRAQDLWYGENHTGWTLQAVREKIKMDFHWRAAGSGLE